MQKEIAIALIGALALIIAAVVSGFFNIENNSLPILNSFGPDKMSPQMLDSRITWIAKATDSDSDATYYSFYLNGPSTNNTYSCVQNWRTQNWWTWIPDEPGTYKIEVRVTDEKDDTHGEICDARDYDYLIIGLANPADAEGWIAKGVALRNLDRYEEAISAYDNALKLDPFNPDSWIKKSYALAKLARYNESLECASQAINLNSSLKSAWFNKGSVLTFMGKFNESLEAFDKALELDKSDEDIWSHRGYVLKRMHRYNESLICFDKAIEMNP